MRYRPEIDGLRAVAVLPVVLFHTGIAGAAGGFVGVDVFFVLSGYLITTIISEDLSRDRFSLRRFYERRFRRIFPALFVVTLVSSVAAWWWMLPFDLREYGKSVIGVALFVSNYLFYRETGYFQPSSENLPLLHTWSLGVEEQFYLVIPALLMLVASLSLRRTLPLVAVLFMISLGMCIVTQPTKPDLAFYSIHTRAWELLAGSLCALWLLDRPQRPSAVLAGTGLVLILGAVIAFDDSTAFPAPWALVPVGGTVLVILFAAPGGPITRLLAWKPFVGIGLISYSVYLWHQPLLAFTRLTAEHEPGQSLLLVAALASLPLGYLSWRFVEVPFRRGKLAARMGQGAFFGGVTAGSGILLLSALAFYVTDGIPERRTPSGQTWAELDITERLAVNTGLHVNCRRGFTLEPKCATGSEPSILLWGDSYAMHLVGALQEALPGGAALRQMTLPSCGPVPTLTLVSSAAETSACRDFNRQVMDWLASDPGIKTVILSSPFAWLATPTLTLERRDGSRVQGSVDEGVAALNQTIDELRALGLRVVVMSPPPTSGWSIGRCLALRARNGEALNACDFDRDTLFSPKRLANEVLAGLADDVPVVWLGDTICEDRRCRAAADGTFLYRDRGHLSNAGSRWLGRQARFRNDLWSALDMVDE